MTSIDAMNYASAFVFAAMGLAILVLIVVGSIYVLRKDEE